MSIITKQKDHAKIFTASGSSKWLNCAGSPKAEQEFFDSEKKRYDEAIKRGEKPEIKQNLAAEEGTLAHELADQCLKNNQDAEEYIDRVISCESDGKVLTKLVDWEIANFVQEYLDYVRSFETEDTQLFTEDKVDFKNVIPEQFRTDDEGFGTMDSAVLNYKTRTCDIFDFKYGIKNKVDAEGNTQGLLYAVGLWNELECLDVIDKFVIHIIQPRMYNISSWEVSIDKLKEFIKYAQKRANEAVKDNPIRTPGDKQCQWCEAKGNCKALEKFTEETITAEFDDLDGETPIQIDQNLSNERIRKILDNAKLITDFLKAVEERAFEKISDGENIPGYKIIRNKGNRKWVDTAEEELKKILKEKTYKEPQIITITEAEKLMNKKEVDKLTYKPDGNMKLVKESAKGEPVKFVKASDFDNLETNDDL